MLDAITKSLVELVGLVLEFSAQTLVQYLKVVILLLQACVYALSLLTGVSILLHLLLEVGSCSLQSLLLLGKSVLNVLTLLLEDETILFSEFILTHDRVYLYVSNLHIASSGLS